MSMIHEPRKSDVDGMIPDLDPAAIAKMKNTVT